MEYEWTTDDGGVSFEARGERGRLLAEIKEAECDCCPPTGWLIRVKVAGITAYAEGIPTPSVAKLLAPKMRDAINQAFSE